MYKDSTILLSFKLELPQFMICTIAMSSGPFEVMLSHAYHEYCSKRVHPRVLDRELPFDVNEPLLPPRLILLRVDRGEVAGENRPVDISSEPVKLHCFTVFNNVG